MAYEVVDSRVTHEGVMATVRVDDVRMPDGEVHAREVVLHADAVAVVPLDDGQVVLVRQYRHAVGDYLLELPAGKLDVEGEAPSAAAARELAEEAGLAAGELVELALIHNSAGWTTESTWLFLATSLHPAEHDFEATAEEADLQVVRLPLEEAADMAAKGAIRDAKTLVGLLIAARRFAS